MSRPLAKREKPGRKYAGIREWQTELSISRLFRTSIRLQTAFDRCFNEFGMTAQEAAVLVHCAEEGETSAGKLARVMGRDKGKITRFVDRLEASGLVSRRNDSRDHRLLIIKATSKGLRFAPQLKTRFEEVRSQFFEGVLNVDIDKLETVLSQLHANAERLCAAERVHKPAQS
ncbi:MAG TPA: MarR family transcriptional regulator [Candidatus Acidoferrum sp.]|nr:MarR family transcriptional regulator [Candidatus Acidoferrum sp.]